MENDAVRSVPDGLSSAAPIEPLRVSPVPALIPSADRCSGTVFVGIMPQLLRDGSNQLIMCWEAERRPVKVCEGGGWYSAHPTKMAWVFRSWMKHRQRPGWTFDKVADEDNTDLQKLIVRDLDRALIRHGFTSAQAIEARRAETQSGSVRESAVGETDAPNTQVSETPSDTLGEKA